MLLAALGVFLYGGHDTSRLYPQAGPSAQWLSTEEYLIADILPVSLIALIDPQRAAEISAVRATGCSAAYRAYVLVVRYGVARRSDAWRAEERVRRCLTGAATKTV